MKQEILDKYIESNKGIWLIFTIETYAQLNGGESPYGKWQNDRLEKSKYSGARGSDASNAYLKWYRNKKCSVPIIVTGETKNVKVTGSKLFRSVYQKSKLEVWCFFKENKFYLKEVNLLFSRRCTRFANGNLINIDLKKINENQLKKIFNFLNYSQYYYDNLGQTNEQFIEEFTRDYIFPQIRSGYVGDIKKEDFFLSIHGGVNQFLGDSSLRNYSYYFEKFLQCSEINYEKSFNAEEPRPATDEEMKSEELEKSKAY